MKRQVLTLTLAAMAASASADDGWVSVGATRVVAPASPQVTQPPSPALPSQSVVAQLPVDNSGSGNLVSELLMQVEQMQNEIATLRGRLEEQGARLERMEREQQDRYLDLDGRVSSLMSASYADTGANKAPVTEASTPDVGKPSPADAYKSAMELVRAKKFTEAGAAFDSFAETYPEAPLLVNALYWSGEVNLVEGHLDVAEARFRRVMTDFASHTKAADATYKLGVTLHKAGKNAEARQVLQSVIDEYSGSADGTVALATSYLKKVPVE